MADQVAHADTAPVQVAGDSARGRVVIFAVVSIALMMASVDQTIVATALPAIQHDLGAQVNWSSWTITVYALGQVMVMPLAGKIGDQFGRKQIFLGAAVLFTSASLCCGLADNIYLLIVLRGGPGHRRRRVHAVGDGHRHRSVRQGPRPRGRAVRQHLSHRRDRSGRSSAACS